ncbi:MAG: dihydroorotate dehydrogenase [Candidatus Omnitrophica bacterium]|nr:dihydroorotate dehydrogenase [Candidatus Omnitrophota bacterium]MCB9770739.1 dihydroorotate dehydrogenase [Candidatus Omnitrophota bacterium]
MMTVDLSVTIGNLKLANPVMPASGTFGYGQEYAGLIDLNDLGAIVSKAVSPAPRPGNKPPRMVELKGALLNSIGLQNPGIEGFIEKKIPFLRQFKPPVVVNVVGNSIEEYRQVVEALDAIDRVDGFEINLSCPNVQKGLEFGTTVDGVARITRELRSATKKDLWMKLTPTVPNPGDLGKAAEGEGADALVAINTIGGMTIDAESRRPVLGARFGGVSGPAIKAVALKYVWLLYESVKIPIIGVGGIFNGVDAMEFILAGATAIQVGTANFVNPTAMPDVISQMADWLEEHGESTLQPLIGEAHRTQGAALSIKNH